MDFGEVSTYYFKTVKWIELFNVEKGFCFSNEKKSGRFMKDSFRFLKDWV